MTQQGGEAFLCSDWPLLADRRGRTSTALYCNFVPRIHRYSGIFHLEYALQTYHTPNSLDTPVTSRKIVTRIRGQVTRKKEEEPKREEASTFGFLLFFIFLHRANIFSHAARTRSHAVSGLSYSLLSPAEPASSLHQTSTWALLTLASTGPAQRKKTTPSQRPSAALANA